jgi:uncharacterized protein (DUF1778 family)
MRTNIDRVYTRIKTEDKEKLMLAANALGITINQFLVQSGLEKAEKLIEQELTIQLSNKERARFFDLLENPPAPSDYLQQAVTEFKNSELIQKDFGKPFEC